MLAQRFKIWMGRAGLTLLAVVLAVAILLVALDLGWQRRFVASFALDRARERLGVEIEVERVGGRLTRGLDLIGVRVGHPARPLFEADRIRVRWDVASFVDPSGADEWIAQKVRIEGWRVALERDDNGRWGEVEDILDRLADGDPIEAEIGDPEAGPRFRVRRLQIDPGQIEVRLAQLPEARSLLPPNARRASETPWSFAWSAQARAEELRIGPDDPLTLSRVEADVRLEDRPGDLPLALERADLHVEMVDRRIDAARLEIAAPGLLAHVEGIGTLDRLEAGRVELDARRLDALGPWLEPWLSGRVPPEGRVQLTLNGSGSEESWSGDVSLEAYALKDGDRQIDAIELAARVDEPITAWPPDPETLDGRLTLKTRGVALGDLAPPEWPDDLLDLDLSARARSGRLSVDDFRIEGAGCRAAGQGRFDPTGMEDVALSFRCDDLGRWTRGAFGDRKWAGQAEGRLEASGPFLSPSGRATLSTSDLSVGDRRIDALRLEVDRPRDRALPGAPTQTNRPLSMELGWRADDEPLAHATASVDLEARDARFALEIWPGLVPYLQPEGAAPPAHGTARGELTLNEETWQLALESTEILIPDLRLVLGGSLALDLSEPTKQWQVDIPELRIERVDANTTPGTSDPAAVRLTLRADGSDAMPSHIDLTLAEVEARTVRAFAPDLPITGGRISGHARVAWPPDQEDWADIALDWATPGMSGFTLDRIHWEAAGRPGWLESKGSLRIAGQEPLSVRTSLPVAADGKTLPDAWPTGAALDARLDDLDLTLFVPWLELSPRWARQLGGRASGRFAVVQTEREPEWSGALDIEEGRATIPLLGQSLRDFEAHVAFDAGAVTLDSMRVRAARGEATIDGRLELDFDAGLPISAHLLFDEFSLSRSRLLQADLSGRVDLDGTLEAPRIRGALDLERAELRIPESRDPVLREIMLVAGRSDASLIEDQQEPRARIAERSDIELTLRVPRTTRIRGQGANLFVEGEVAAVQEPGQPLRFIGETNVANGTFVFQGKRFLVRRGRVRMAGDERGDPLLDIEAVLPLRDILAFVIVEGRLSDPIVRLRSEPARSEQDVLSYLLFGRPASEVEAAQGGAFSAAATAVVAGVAERELREMLGDAMFIDTIEIGANNAGETESLGVGRYIGPDVFIRYVHLLGDKPADRAEIEYRINSLFSIGSSASMTGDTGLDLIIRHDF
jgi:autotransporter translocation and assembly factor TamB